MRYVSFSLIVTMNPKISSQYLTSQGLSDAQIQLISGHESKKSLEIYQHLSLGAGRTGRIRRLSRGSASRTPNDARVTGL